MPPVSRKLAFVVLVGAALLASGCSSNNTGKIVGKWKIISAPGMEDFDKVAQQTQLAMFFEFESNGTFALSFDSPNQAVMGLLKQQFGTTRFLAKYKLLSGDGIELYDFSPGPLADAFQKKGESRARSNMKINGDDMTMTDPDGKTGKLVRYKEPAAPQPKPNP